MSRARAARFVRRGEDLSTDLDTPTQRKLGRNVRATIGASFSTSAVEARSDSNLDASWSSVVGRARRAKEKENSGFEKTRASPVRIPGTREWR
jgi:hypothetical protein